jgi:hypothetical protein
MTQQRAGEHSAPTTFQGAIFLPKKSVGVIGN